MIPHRPKVVPIIAAFLFAATLIAVAVAVSLLLPGTFLDRMWEINRPAYATFHAVGELSGVLLLLLSIGTAAAARGLLRGAKWAWWFSIFLFAVNGFGDVITLLITRDLLKSGSGVFIAAIFLLCLLRSDVATFFKARV